MRSGPEMTCTVDFRTAAAIFYLAKRFVALTRPLRKAAAQRGPSAGKVLDEFRKTRPGEKRTPDPPHLKQDVDGDEESQEG